jgi:phosphotransferase system HPr-like phosphotransfer protein
VYLRDDSYAVDAKSVLGLFSLDLSKPLNVEIHANECDQLLEDLSVFCI